MHSQSELVKNQIEHLLNTGVRNKSRIYTKIVTETGLPRSTVRRIAGDYKKEIERKIKILSATSRLKKPKEDPYSFIPVKIRFLWTKITKNDLDIVRCSICKKLIGYIEGFCDGNLVCDGCRFKFPQKRIRKNEKRY